MIHVKSQIKNIIFSKTSIVANWNCPFWLDHPRLFALTLFHLHKPLTTAASSMEKCERRWWWSERQWSRRVWEKKRWKIVWGVKASGKKMKVENIIVAATLRHPHFSLAVITCETFRPRDATYTFAHNLQLLVLRSRSQLVSFQLKAFPVSYVLLKCNKPFQS